VFYQASVYLYSPNNTAISILYLIFIDYYYLFWPFQPPSGKNTGSQKD